MYVERQGAKFFSGSFGRQCRNTPKIFDDYQQSISCSWSSCFSSATQTYCSSKTLKRGFPQVNARHSPSLHISPYPILQGRILRKAINMHRAQLPSLPLYTGRGKTQVPYFDTLIFENLNRYWLLAKLEKLDLSGNLSLQRIQEKLNMSSQLWDRPCGPLQFLEASCATLACQRSKELRCTHRAMGFQYLSVATNC